MYKLLYAMFSVIAYCDALIPYKHIFPECKPMKACVLQLMDINGIMYGDYETLTDAKILKKFCQAEDQCSGLNFKDIDKCSSFGDDESTVKYTLNVRKYLCSGSGRKDVAALYQHLCPTRMNYVDCISKKQIEKKLSKESCGFVDYQTCIIQIFDKICGPAYSSLHRKIFQIMLSIRPDCIVKSI
ncbi:hypothetical protein Btru_023849 [Bulinus truncatus]|nr:hypothetical protein Btru_023849 [Bulinus truncatus]